MNSGAALANLLIIGLPLLLIVFLVMSQRRRQRDARALQSSLEVGDEVVTTSGMYGVVVGLDQGSIELEVADGVTVRFDRRAVGMKAPGRSPGARREHDPDDTDEPDGDGSSTSTASDEGE